MWVLPILTFNLALTLIKAQPQCPNTPSPTTNQYLMDPLRPLLHQLNPFDGPPAIAQAPSTSQTIKPDKELVTYYNYFAASVYCSQELKYLNCCYCKFFNGTVSFHKILANATMNTRALLTVHPERKEIVVTFRGTYNLLNLILDFASAQVDVGSDVRFHVGNFVQTMSLYHQVVTQLDEQLGANPGFSVVLVGHSLGGAMASITLYFLTFLNQFPSVPLSLYTYGQPRIGNKGYTDFVNNLNIPIARVTARADMVPHRVPVSTPGSRDIYHHHQNEYWVNGTGRYCSTLVYEDPICSNSQGPAYTMVDHLKYLDVNYAACYFGTPAPLLQLPFGIFDPEKNNLIPPTPTFITTTSQAVAGALFELVHPTLG